MTPEALEQLRELGYPALRCVKALSHCGGDIERAAMMIMEKAEEPDEFWIFKPEELAWCAARGWRPARRARQGFSI